MIGQGKLICRLNTTETSLFATDVGNRGNSSENSQIITIRNHDEYNIEHLNEQITSEMGDQDETPESSSNQLVLTNVNLTNPSSIQSESRVAELEELVHDLSTDQDSRIGMFQSLQDALKYLKSKMSDDSEKLKLDEEDVLSDVLTYLKNSSITFISHYKCVTEGNQPLILVEFIDSSSQQYMNKYCLVQMKFHPYLKVMLPSYPYLIHTLQLVSEIMEAIGKIMAHFIVQLGIVPGFFPTAAYMCICSGDSSTTIPFNCWHNNIQNKILPG